MESTNEDNLINIFKYLDDNSKLNCILASKWIFFTVLISQKLLREFILYINYKNYKLIFQNPNIINLPIKNVSINFKNLINIQQMFNFVSCFPSIETLELTYLKISKFTNDFIKFLSNLLNLKYLKLNDCFCDSLISKPLPIMTNLESISFDKCDDNIFKLIVNQNSPRKITVSNKDWSWTGFPHDVFNEICKNCKNLNYLVLDGAGTGSYFNSDEFPFRITKLETTMISFHWYVGIKNHRINFLESQKGSLKKLTIHELPYDFDGGGVLKYIIEEMNLETFFYGKIPLILNGQKQKVKEFTASEIQITSAYEMLRQFPSIEKFTLKLSKTDIASDAIEKIINSPTDIFKNLKEFEVIDNSSNRGIFEVFLGLYKNLRNLQKLTLRTQDRNINTILECLEEMIELEEILLTSTATRAKERYQIIQKLAPNLKKLFIPIESFNEASEAFDSINFYDVESLRCLNYLSISIALPARGGHCQLMNQEPTEQAILENIKNNEPFSVKVLD